MFSLSGENDAARLESVLSALEIELAAWGFSFQAEPKSSGEQTGIESAFLKRSVPVNLPHLAARIRQSGNRDIENLDLAGLQSLLSERFGKVDLAAAADEVRPYLRDARELALWSEAFFKELIPRVTGSAT